MAKNWNFHFESDELLKVLRAPDCVPVFSLNLQKNQIQFVTFSCFMFWIFRMWPRFLIGSLCFQFFTVSYRHGDHPQNLERRL